MRILLIALATTGCSKAILYPAGYRLPPTPTSYWIWESYEAAKEWVTTHNERLCITQVPDGFATEGC